jgi:hypothetical protein
MPLPPALGPTPMDLPPGFTPPTLDPYVVGVGTVETFDPIGRARLIAELLPRRWSGTFRPFASGEVQPVQLELSSTEPVGQMVDLRGRITIGTTSTDIQGNINAKSDQLDLLVLGDASIPGLEPGTGFQGLQGLSLSGTSLIRLTDPGARLQLEPEIGGAPAPAGSGDTIRGLW